MLVSCDRGFDGGHEAAYHLELFESNHVMSLNVTRSEPVFELHSLKPGHDYALMLFASNALGRSPSRRINVTTLNVAERRTAETRSKLEVGVGAAAAGVMTDDGVSSSGTGGGVAGGQQAGDPGLALLPIIAILCGVAVGLTTVALGVVLLVRGRADDDSPEGEEADARPKPFDRPSVDAQHRQLLLMGEHAEESSRQIKPCRGTYQSYKYV
jgi:hypothetical protein